MVFGRVERSALTRRTSVFLATLLLAALYLFVWDLGSYPLQSWDEGIYAVIALRAADGGHWLIPSGLWGGSVGPFLLKPPLAFWIEGASISVLGPSEFAVRLPSTLATVGTGIVVYSFGRRLRDDWAGLLAGVVFFTTPFVYAGQNAGRTGGVDMEMLLFGTLFVYSVWRTVADDEQHWLWVAGIAGGLAVLTKGFAAGIFVLIVLPIVASTLRRFLTRHGAGMVAVTISITLPWAAAMYVHFGSRFIHDIFITQVLGRASGSLSSSGSWALFGFMQYPYVKLLPIALDPWIYYVPFAVLVLGYTAYRTNRWKQLRTLGFLTWWVCIVFVFFALTGNHSWYVLPMFPATALLVALLFRDTVRNRLARYGIFCGLVVFGLFSYRLPGIALDTLPLPFAAEQLDNAVIGGNVPTGAVFIAVAISLPLAAIVISEVDIALSNVLSYDVRTVLGGVLALVLITGLAAPCAVLSPTGGNGDADLTWNAQQKQLGEQTATVVSHDAVVALSDDISGPLFPYTFYTGGNAAVVSNHDYSGYPAAILRPSELDTLNREYRVVATATNNAYGTVVVITFE
ncbi:ArnT family glycosyltransferase [Salarchaeum japonicum]|uniref:ArnT family glycosyltransferase n=1 Tax=Salarchaeum japonicum TaxID=555573 RepID=UPI003C71AF01